MIKIVINIICFLLLTMVPTWASDISAKKEDIRIRFTLPHRKIDISYNQNRENNLTSLKVEIFFSGFEELKPKKMTINFPHKDLDILKQISSNDIHFFGCSEGYYLSFNTTDSNKNPIIIDYYLNSDGIYFERLVRKKDETGKPIYLRKIVNPQEKNKP